MKKGKPSGDSYDAIMDDFLNKTCAIKFQGNCVHTRTAISEHLQCKDWKSSKGAADLLRVTQFAEYEQS